MLTGGPALVLSLCRRSAAPWFAWVVLCGADNARAQQPPLAPVAPSTPIVKVAPVVTELPGPAGGPRSLLVRFTPPVDRVSVTIAGEGARVRLPVAGRWSEPRPVPDVLTAPEGGPVVSVLIELPAGAEVRALSGAARSDAAPRSLGRDVTTPTPIDRLPRFWSSWPVTAPDARAGQPVRVPLPLELFVLADVGPKHVRPLQGKSVLPFALEEGLALEPVVARVEPAAGRWTVALPAFAAQLTQLELIAPQATFTAPVAVDYRAVSRRGQPVRTVEGPRAAWRCTSDDVAGCNLLLPITPPPGAPALEITGPLPAGTAVRLWAPLSALVFAWPARGSVRLVSGFDPVRADAPQVQSVRAQLAGVLASAGLVDPAATSAEKERLAGRAPWIVVWATVLATAALLFVVMRSLARARRRGVTAR